LRRVNLGFGSNETTWSRVEIIGTVGSQVTMFCRNPFSYSSELKFVGIRRKWHFPSSDYKSVTPHGRSRLQLSIDSVQHDNAGPYTCQISPRQTEVLHAVNVTYLLTVYGRSVLPLDAVAKRATSYMLGVLCGVLCVILCLAILVQYTGL